MPPGFQMHHDIGDFGDGFFDCRFDPVAYLVGIIHMHIGVNQDV